MKQKTNTNSIKNIINELISKKVIPFNFKEDKYTEEQKMKLDIVKFMCYKDKKLSIVGLFDNKYAKELINSALSFLQKLVCFSLENMISSYEPEDYSILKKSSLFKFYLKSTKKELVSFFLFLGFYSYLNKRMNNIKEIIQFQSNNYFDKSINLYVNLKNLSLPQIINHYRKYCLLGQNKKLDLDEDKEGLNPEEFDLILCSYSFYKDIYLKNDTYFLIDSFITSITNKKISIYLKDGNDYEIVNNLIDCLIDKIYDTFKLGYFEDNEVSLLINNLYDTILEYMEYSIDFNYIKFVHSYCNELNDDKNNIKLVTICKFFQGLNPDNFIDTFNKIKIPKGECYYANIEKYYSQIHGKNDTEKKNINNSFLANEIFLNNDNKNILCDNDEKIPIKNRKKINNKNAFENVQVNDENNKIKNIINEQTRENDEHKKDDIIDINDNKEFDKRVNMEKNEIKNNDDTNEKNNMFEKIKKLELELKASEDKEKQIQNDFIEFKTQTSLNIINLLNNYIEKYTEEISFISNKKDKAYYIGDKILKGKEKCYFNKIIKKYYHSNDESHFSGLIKNYQDNTKKLINTEIANLILKEYLLHIPEIDKNVNYSKEKNYIIKLFDLNKIISYLYKTKKYF